MGFQTRMVAVFSKYVAAYTKQIVADVRSKTRAVAAKVDVAVAVGVAMALGGMVAVGATVYYGLLTPYLEWIAALGLWGNALMVVSFVPVSVPFVMGYTPLTLATGYIYGIYGGIVTSQIGALLGACVAFVGTRMLCRDALRAKLDKSLKFRGFMKAVESHGFKIVVLMRLVPVPFGIQNGAFAVSNISFGRYMVATALGVLPGQVMINYFGTTIHSLGDILSGKHEFSEWQTYMLYSQGLVVAFLFVFLGYLSKRAMAYAELDDALDIARSSGKSAMASSPHGLAAAAAPVVLTAAAASAAAADHPDVDATARDKCRPRTRTRRAGSHHKRHLKASSSEDFDTLLGAESGGLSVGPGKSLLTFDYARRSRGSVAEETRVLRTTSNSNIALTVAHHHPSRH
ncbi:SNARE associated Golgi protein [Thecamonas trahens ATCC 50062]|uniref:SNARE associated Golgi protein n=1 Tax=Thecamonas trahens ATCC 50062 TaxID=461836 RepID=A0A0L0DGT7_THETB|nr:SNARE associated Golgi protein [Thecamonas trahens ATCC 50062]KNC50543.1 SNARE associated Golgi protein [Thecamonas trahens ATCC 50062]|eukprot:XP_013762435.1 SNARE associated Golgi protein [Thecamonas trahens ATCC 50062]